MTNICPICKSNHVAYEWETACEACRRVSAPPSFVAPTGNPVTAEIAAREPAATPAPPPAPRLVAKAPGPFRMKVSCVRCHDVYMDDVVPGTLYVCADCAPQLAEEIKATNKQQRLQLMPHAAAIDECIRVTKLEADDVLLLRLPRGASPEVIQDITSKLSASKIRVVVIAADVDVEVLRPSPSPKDPAHAE